MADINGTENGDVLVGTPDSDTINGHGGNDVIYGHDGGDTLLGGDGDDRIEAGAGADGVLGGAGADYIAGGADGDFLFGEDGNDTILGEEGDDRLYGGAGADGILGGAGADYIEGGADGDFLFGEDGDDTILGGDGDDTLEGGAGNDGSSGGAGNDRLYGGAGSDWLSGDDGDDLIHGGDDVDIILGGLGSDALYGEAGDDRIEGGAGADGILGGVGADYIAGGADGDFLFGEDGNDTILGEDGNDHIEAGAGGDGVLGGAGADYIAGGADGDFLFGEDGDDTILGEDGDDRMYGGAGADGVLGGAGADYIEGGADGDFLFGEDGDDTISGGDGDDTLEGGAGNDGLSGGAGNDRLYGAAGSDWLFGDDGDDLIHGGDDVDRILGGLGSDTLYGEAGDDRIEGDAGVDGVLGGVGADYIAGGADGDFLFGEDGADTILGDDGNDHIEAGAGADGVLGGAGADHIAGGADGDFLFGEAGDDTILGDEGDDSLDGGLGSDGLVGGAGADTFAFTTALGASNVDFIADFVAGSDRIRLGGEAGLPFAALASGTLRAETFVIGAAAVNADDYLIYNSGTGALLYDVDGSGGAAAVQFATLSAGLSLTAADFFVSGPGNAAPVVTSGGTVSIAENSPASAIVYQATASDADGDRITFSLSGADAALLTIDAVTGAVRLISPADYETKTSYAFNVIASDSGSSTPRAVTLTITDVADVATPIINETTAPNDATASAQAVDRGTFVVAANPNLPDDDLPSATIRGNLPDAADKDFFSITLQAGEKLILDVDNSGGNLDAFVRVYNSSGVEIGSNDDQGSPDPGSDPHPTYGHNTDSLFSFRAATSGTYYFSIESFQDAANPTFGSYDLNVSIGPPATAQQLIEEDIDALVSGSKWTDTDLTFGFPTLASQYPDSFDEANPDGEFQAFSAAQQAATRQLLQLVGNVSSLTFTEMTASPGQADLRYAMSTDDDVEAAHAYYPSNGGPSSPGGSAWFNTTSFTNPLKGNYAWMGILHETGHALGLKHGHEAPAIRTERDSVEYTVMTYRSYVGDDAEGYNNALYGFPQTLMMYDIAALQRIYGANFVHNAGNSVYTWSPTNGEMFINGVGQGAPGDGVSSQANRVFQTIWDGGGIDTYDLSNYGVNGNSSTIDLRPGEWTTTDGLQLAALGGGNVARGNVANALMYQGNVASLIENAIGTGDVDFIVANQAANQLTGGGGNDVFRWAAGTDAGTGALADTITDLIRGNDQINLSDVDAKSGTAENDAFTFIATSAFSNVAGQLRYQVEGGNARIQADLDGNGIADMEIVVINNTILAASDFVF
ncbi:MAG TPA: M10 family metallopeptidase C-terminal domain-containing protein [Allosphingosinicella sp.]|nr:M10 family metallopeptidase C-terminal domain-containing protein [Allosphingosinicella sp.]